MRDSLSNCTGSADPQGVLALIGRTPLVQLTRYLDRADVALFAKLEAFNPGGSAKDRPARHMVAQALAYSWGQILHGA